MFSSDHREANALTVEKHKIRRACDVCRRKKIRCDGADVPDNQCSNCVAYGLDCTYVEAAKKRGPPKGYVEFLENRLKKTEKIIKRLVPDIDLSSPTAMETLVFPNHSSSVIKNICATVVGPDEETEKNKADRAMNIATLSIGAISNKDAATAPLAQPEADADSLSLVESMKLLTLNNECRFFGKSSELMLVETALDIKQDYARSVGAAVPSSELESIIRSPRMPSSSSFSSFRVPSLRRPEFWSNRSWESGMTHYNPITPTPILSSTDESPLPPETSPNRYSFPPPDLMHNLIDLYFYHSNTFLPLLHYPTFISQVFSGLHLHAGTSDESDGFAACLLLVCAIGSRWSTDPRVRLDNLGEEEKELGWHSNGWKWFNQVQLIRRSLLQPPGLYDLQFYCLSVMFLKSTSAPQACWTMVGIGIRLAQDVGAHRRKIRKIPSSPPSSSEKEARERIEEELWSRAWWVLVCLDRILSSAMGRPCAIQDEDFDLEMPVVVDDEYWEDPSGAHSPSQMFKQPAGKPSLLAYFVMFIKLMKLLAFSLRTIYAIKPKIRLGLAGPTWEQHVVAEIDSTLNKWVDSVPPHLRWDPHHPNPIFFNQSSLLYVWYYHLQILIHRPFIPSPRKPSPLSFPSLAICTNAARGCCHVADTHRRRVTEEIGRIRAIQPYNIVAVFTSGIVLLLNIWGRKRSSKGGESGIDVGKEMGDVHKCMLILGLSEERWHSAGRLWDVLAELASVGELPLPLGSSSGNLPPTSATGYKRRWGEGEVSSSMVAPSPMPGYGTEERNITSSNRIIAQPMLTFPDSQQQQQHPQLQQLSAFSLPMYSNELGRLPSHGYLMGIPLQQTQAQDWFTPNSISSSTMVGGYIPPTSSPFFLDSSSSSGGSSSFYTPQEQTFSTLDLPPFLNDTSTTRSAGGGGGILDNEIMTMWSNVPNGFELDDWGAYLELLHQAQVQEGI